jgi:dTDP-4-dehydrorhamnose reductase
VRAIVVGADGSIGGALARELACRGNTVYGTTRRTALVAEDRPFLDLALNVEDVMLPEADIAFFCAAVVSFAECRLNPSRARHVNVTSPVALAQRMSAAGTRVVLLSTSAVFDWSMPRVPATHPLCPVSKYGEIVAEAETEFSKLGSASILRLTKLLTGKLALFSDWIDKLSQGEEIVAYTDIHVSPVTIDDVLIALFAVAADPASGIYQVSGARDISYYEAACHISDVLNRDRKLIIERRGVDVGIPRQEAPRYASLDPSRITKLTGWVPPEPFDVIDRVFSTSFAKARSHSVTVTSTDKAIPNG